MDNKQTPKSNIIYFPTNKRREQVEALRSELVGDPLAVERHSPITTPSRLPSGSQAAAADLARVADGGAHR